MCENQLSYFSFVGRSLLWRLVISKQTPNELILVYFEDIFNVKRLFLFLHYNLT